METEQELLIRYAESVAMPLVGKRGVENLTIKALREAGFSVSNICDIKGSGRSGKAWGNGDTIAMQIGTARQKSGVRYRYTLIRVVTLTLKESGAYDAWYRKEAIEQLLLEL